jgi:hypothetical protein
MEPEGAPAFKYFLSYSGVKLPLSMVTPIDVEALCNRNTYFRASYDSNGRMVRCEKIVYGEVELQHDYVYGPDGRLASARIDMAGEETEVSFDEAGVGTVRHL